MLSLSIGILMALVLAEGSLWILDVEPFQVVTKRWLVNEEEPGILYHCYPSNPHNELDPVPDVSSGPWKLTTALLTPIEVPLSRLNETPFCVEYRNSTQGLRDRIFDPYPREGMLRIVGVGDSFAVGEGVPEDLSLLRHLDRALGENVEVLNGGRPGADTAEEAQTLKRLTKKFNSTRGLIVFVPNDVVLTTELSRRQEYIHDLINIRSENLEEYENDAWYTGHSRLAHFVGSFFAMKSIKAGTVQWYLDSYSDEHNSDNLVQLRRDFESVARLPGVQVGVVLYPLLEGLEGGYPLASVHEVVEKIATSTGLPVLDLAPVFSGMKSETLWVHPVDHHPNGTAHRLAAQAIADWLKTVPGFLTP